MKNGVIPLEVKGTVKTIINGKRRRTVEEHEKYVDVRNACYRKRSEKNMTINYFSGFDDGAEFGYNKANEWHYVKDGDLPKHNNEVLCLLWGGTKEIGYYKNEMWYFEDFTADKDDVDYWQEIKLPKEIE